MKSCIFWMILIILLTAGLYIASIYLWSESHTNNFYDQDVKRRFDVPLYRCPVKIEVSIKGNANASFFIVDADKDTKENEENITYQKNTDSFTFEGELEKGGYFIKVQHIEGENYNEDSKVKFENIQIFIIKPLMKYVYIGGGAIELLLLIWLISIIIRKRNLTKEMILVSTGEKNAPDEEEPYPHVHEKEEVYQRDEFLGSGSTNYDFTAVEESKLQSYPNNADDLYGKDYELPSVKRTDSYDSSEEAISFGIEGERSEEPSSAEGLHVMEFEDEFEEQRQDRRRGGGPERRRPGSGTRRGRRGRSPGPGRWGGSGKRSYEGTGGSRRVEKEPRRGSSGRNRRGKRGRRKGPSGRSGGPRRRPKRGDGRRRSKSGRPKSGRSRSKKGGPRRSKGSGPKRPSVAPFSHRASRSKPKRRSSTRRSKEVAWDEAEEFEFDGPDDPDEEDVYW